MTRRLPDEELTVLSNPQRAGHFVCVEHRTSELWSWMQLLELCINHTLGIDGKNDDTIGHFIELVIAHPLQARAYPCLHGRPYVARTERAQPAFVKVTGLVGITPTKLELGSG